MFRKQFVPDALDCNQSHVIRAMFAVRVIRMPSTTPNRSGQPATLPAAQMYLRRFVKEPLCTCRGLPGDTWRVVFRRKGLRGGAESHRHSMPSPVALLDLSMYGAAMPRATKEGPWAAFNPEVYNPRLCEPSCKDSQA